MRSGHFDGVLEPITRPDPVSTEVARRLLDQLVSGKLEVGQKIPSERQLALSLGVGRLAIRDAVKQLQLLGLLDVRAGDGTYVKTSESVVLPRVIEWALLLKADRIQELIETRRFIEVALAGLAAQRRDANSIDRLEKHLSAMHVDMSNWHKFVEADIAFHLEVAAAANNTVLAGLLSSLGSLLEAWMARVLKAAGETESFHAEHVPIFNAIKAGDRQAAEQAMGAHIDRATDRLFNAAMSSSVSVVSQGDASSSGVLAPTGAPWRSLQSGDSKTAAT